MQFRRLHFLPVALFLLVMCTFAATYAIAVWLEHVEPGFPYISDTGTVPPESCIFAQFINLAAFLLLCCVGVRHLQVRGAQARAPPRALPRRLVAAASLLGCASCLGLDLVANFQESSVLAVHMAGAFLCFFAGTFYFCLQTYISRQLMPHVTTPFAFGARVVISALCVLLTISTITCGTLSMRQFNGSDVKKWRPEDGGWALHVASAASEWLLAACFCAFIASFSAEFRGLVLEGPVLRVRVQEGPLDTEEPLHKPPGAQSTP